MAELSERLQEIANNVEKFFKLYPEIPVEIPNLYRNDKNSLINYYKNDLGGDSLYDVSEKAVVNSSGASYTLSLIKSLREKSE
jgi:translation initiation factor 2 beta subunit (eIF-2beta)/eIF-5